jgi:uncharacterized membrane protein YebE (DUF533 family)
MFDAKRLLDQFIGTDSGARRPASPQGTASSGAPAAGQDWSQLLEGKGGLATGAIAGGLAGYLLGGKKKKKLAKNALTYGGLAVIGGLAYKAWRDHQQGRPAQVTAENRAEPLPPPPADTRFVPQDEADEESLARGLLRAMIAAAKADGHIDADEQRRIFEHVGGLELDNDDKAFVFEELSRPLDIDAVAEVATSPERAAELYAASLLAIDADGPAEKGYLSMLAARLQLAPDLVDHLHASVDAASETA